MGTGAREPAVIMSFAMELQSLSEEEFTGSVPYVTDENLFTAMTDPLVVSLKDPVHSELPPPPPKPKIEAPPDLELHLFLVLLS